MRDLSQLAYGQCETIGFPHVSGLFISLERYPTESLPCVASPGG